MSRLDLADGLRMLHHAGSDHSFGHAEHLAFAWSALDEADTVEEAIDVVSLTIRHAATLAGNPEKFHVTMTVFWVRMLEHVRAAHPGVTSVEDALAVFPDLADASLHDRHWSDINDEQARRQWVEPDLEPMP